MGSECPKSCWIVVSSAGTCRRLYALPGAHRVCLRQPRAALWVDLRAFRRREQAGLYAWGGHVKKRTPRRVNGQKCLRSTCDKDGI
jgi:hypothetical protein